jgi:hypothetical protein
MLNIEIKANEGLPAEEILTTLESRARYQWLIDHTPIADRCTFPGGQISFTLYKAARYCYVYGYYLASVILGLSYVEKTLDGCLSAHEPVGSEKHGLAVLIRRALAERLIDEQTAACLKELLKKRNAIPPFYIREKNGFANMMDNGTENKRYGIGAEEALQIMEMMMALVTSRKG